MTNPGWYSPHQGVVSRRYANRHGLTSPAPYQPSQQPQVQWSTSVMPTPSDLAFNASQVYYSEPGKETIVTCAQKGQCLNLQTGKCDVCVMPGKLPFPLPGVPPVPPGKVPPGVPPVPGLVSELACKKREQAAYNRGVAKEKADLVRTTLIAAAITAVVSGAIGYGFSRF